jgi:hypothetical protein
MCHTIFVFTFFNNVLRDFKGDMENFIDVKVGDRIEEKNIPLGSPEQNNRRVIVTRSKVFFKAGILWLMFF